VNFKILEKFEISIFQYFCNVFSVKIIFRIWKKNIIFDFAAFFQLFSFKHAVYSLEFSKFEILYFRFLLNF